MATKHKQTVPTGTTVQFTKYAEDAEGGELRANDILTIVGFDKADGVYNVRCEATGIEDSLYPDEFTTEVTAPKGKAKAAPKAKAEAAPKATAKAEPVAETKAKAKAKVEVKVEPEPETVVVKDEEEVLPKYRATASVQHALKEADGDYLKAAHSLAESEAKTKFVLGGVLAKIKRDNLQATIPSDEKNDDGEVIPLYTADLPGFNAYVRDALNLHDRKAHTLVNIYEKFSQITTETKINKVGWTKLRELLPLDLNADNVEEWLTKAKTLHTDELHESVRQTLVEGGGEVHGKRSLNTQVAFKFVAFNDQAEMWKQAIAEAKTVIGEEQTDSMALNHIITEWLDSRHSEA